MKTQLTSDTAAQGSYTSSDLLEELSRDRNNGNLDDVRSLFNSITDRNLKLDILLMVNDRVEDSNPEEGELESAQLMRTLLRTLIFNS